MTPEPDRLIATLGDACTLPTADQPLRVAEFDGLFADHLMAVEHLESGIRLHLAGPDGLVDVVRDLSARETACCSFFAFTVTESAGRVVLDVAVPSAYADVLAALTARARTALGQ